MVSDNRVTKAVELEPGITAVYDFSLSDIRLATAITRMEASQKAVEQAEKNKLELSDAASERAFKNLMRLVELLLGTDNFDSLADAYADKYGTFNEEHFTAVIEGAFKELPKASEPSESSARQKKS